MRVERELVIHVVATSILDRDEMRGRPNLREARLHRATKAWAKCRSLGRGRINLVDLEARKGVCAISNPTGRWEPW